jgi:hypothetical protein
MVTTIQVSEELKYELKQRKLSVKESYEDVIWDLIEDTMELSEETLKDIEISRKEAKEGKLIPFEDIIEELGL